MKTVIQFLRKLKENNNREWFMDHKQEYLDAQATFNAFVEKILIGLSEADESVSEGTYCEGLHLPDLSGCAFLKGQVAL